MSHVRLTKGGSVTAQGLQQLRLALWRKGAEAAHLTTVSGQPQHQVFRIGRDSMPGSMEIIPEGHYRLGAPEFKGGPGDFASIWTDGLGPVVVEITNAVPNQTRRGDLEIHSDWNQATSPGTAGCIGIDAQAGNLAQLKTVLTWFATDAPRDLYVDWGLGTCPGPRDEG